MEAVKKVVVDDLKRTMRHNHHTMIFAHKVLSVLLGEVLSSTVYEILTVIMVGDGSMSDSQTLIARTIYALLISVYSPLMGWSLSKYSRGMDSFIGIMLQSHSNMCPILLSWGWKDWAAALDTWAGANLWDECVVAVVLTLLVGLAQATPCFNNNKAAVASGGGEDTLQARIMIMPSGLGLALGYLWNVVATFFVGEVQDLHAGNYKYAFVIQAAYSVIACTVVTKVTEFLHKKQAEPQDDKPDPHGALNELNDWVGLHERSVKNLICTVLSFIYGWSILDTMDDWVFGVMYQCTSYSKCSYQSNYVYAMGVTVAFTACSFVLNRAKQLMEGGILEAVKLQDNALVLTVGWAWMNFYATFMSAATSGIKAWHKVGIYVLALVVVFKFHSITQFVLQRTNRAWTKKMMDSIDALEKATE